MSARNLAPTGLSVTSIVLIAIWASLAAAQPAQQAPAPKGPAEQLFATAHQRFVRGRELQKLHRNTPEAAQELGAAFDGYREVIKKFPDDPIVPRAMYMSGSAKLFLDQYDAAIATYQEVIGKHASNREYLAKALTRKASAEKARLDPAASRKTIDEYFVRFKDDAAAPERSDADKIKKSLEVIGRAATPIEASKWFNPLPSGAALKGKVTLLYFFATWCPNCLKEIDFINDLHKRFGPKGLQLIAITHHSRGQTDETVAQYIKDHGFSFPTAVDKGGATSQAYSGGSVPTAVLIDSAGMIRWHDHPAAVPDAAVERLLADTSTKGKGT